MLNARANAIFDFANRAWTIFRHVYQLTKSEKKKFNYINMDNINYFT